MPRHQIRGCFVVSFLLAVFILICHSALYALIRNMEWPCFSFKRSSYLFFTKLISVSFIRNWIGYFEGSGLN